MPKPQHPKLAGQVFDHGTERVRVSDVKVGSPERETYRAASGLDADPSEREEQFRERKLSRQYAGERAIFALGQGRWPDGRADLFNPTVTGNAHRVLSRWQISEQQSRRRMNI